MNQSRHNLINTEILIVDDMPENLDLLCQTLESSGYQVIVASSGEIALKIAERTRPDLILLDVMMPGLNGFETCRRLKTNEDLSDIPVIFITAKDETESVIEGFQVGGVDYIQKPFKEAEVLARVETHLKIAKLTKALFEKNAELAQSNERLRGEIARREKAETAHNQADEQLSIISQQEAERWGIDGFIGRSQTIDRILKDVSRLQTTGTVSVLITGESGTGKELIARAIHFGGRRAKRPFIPVNCSATPRDLAESTFFGHVRGAFTGANTDRKGHFELADGGTLFLDEIGDMPLELQAKLLRVLEDGCVTPIGGTHEKQVDVRIVAATNADLQERIADGTFREDLYFRLAQFTVVAPPLRERSEDISLLADHFLHLFALEMGVEKPALSQEALAALRSHPFPGNVRELRNVIMRALIESDGAEISTEHLHFVPTASTPASPRVTSPPASTDHEIPLNLQQAEALLIQRALDQTSGNISEAARLLGIGRQTLYRKLEQKT